MRKQTDTLSFLDFLIMIKNVNSTYVLKDVIATAIKTQSIENSTGMTCIIQSLCSDWISDEDAQKTTVETSG